MKLPNRVYDALKWTCILGLPALQRLYSALAEIWGWPFAEQIPATLSAVTFAIGTIIGISSANYQKKGSDSHDGNATS